jgi:predicted dehydrogenase
LAASIHRVGIIGAGAAARLHLRALRRIKGLQVVCIGDLHAKKAATLAAEFGLPTEVVVDARDFYERRPQSVHVVTHPASHEDIAFEALQHGWSPKLRRAGCRSE